MNQEDNARPWLLGSGVFVAVVAAVKLILHLYAGRHYGYFVDELYYLACAQHLDWGYVDQPPLVVLIARLVRMTVGDSLPALRLLPGLAGVTKVILAGWLARELGGRRFAQGIAALSVLIAPGFLAMDNWFSMNPFEPLFWTGCACILVRMIKTGNQRLWLWFGVLAGFGLENKYSMAIFGFGLVVGLLLSPERRLLKGIMPWLGGVIAFAIFAPNLLWNVQHHFPFLELQRNIRADGRNVPMPPYQFIWQEMWTMLLVNVPIWVAGLWHLLVRREGRQFRALGWACLVAAAIIMIMSPRVYYLYPAFPVALAAGGVAWESWLSRPRLQWVMPAYAALMILMGALVAPAAVPVLSPETYIRYARAMHIEQPRVETFRLGPLPQLYADQFGWPEMAAMVAAVYNRLPADVRPKTAIFGQNYGEAGSIDLFGPKYGLPKAISGHQNYFLWGPRGYTGESMIVMGDRRETLEGLFAHVEWAGHVSHPYSMPYEHIDVFYCAGLKEPLIDLWPKVKNWH